MNKPKNEPKASAKNIQEKIRLRAYELWEQSGGQHGHDESHWVQAELELKKKTKKGE
jgi:hypothetical protein